MNSRREIPDEAATERRLGEFLAATVRYIPLLTGLLALGLVAVYALAYYGILGQPEWQLLIVAAVSLVVGLAHFPVAALAEHGHGKRAHVLYAILLDVWAITLVFFWESAWPVAVLMAWAPPAAAFGGRSSRRRLLVWLAISVGITAALFLLDRYPLIARTTMANQASVASLVLVGSTVLLFVIGTFFVRLFPYRSVQTRLVTPFVLIMAVPVLITTAISASSAFTNSQEQYSNSLDAVARLKQDQIEAHIQSIALEMSPLEQGSGAANSIMHVLYPAGISEESYRLNLSAASTQLRDLIDRYPGSAYEEVFVMDVRGNVVLSTYMLDQGANFSGEDFFRLGLSRFHGEMIRFPSELNPAGEYKLVVAAPIYGAKADDVRGVIGAVIDSALILKAMGPVTGLPGANTYIVNTRHELVTPTVSDNSITIKAAPILHAVTDKVDGRSDFYANQTGTEVLGYTSWDDEINGVIVAEVPRAAVYNRALTSLLLSAMIGLFAIIIAGITAISTATAIADPIRHLATVARSISKGDLGARTSIDQRDEVGDLASSFNDMAVQLQGMIGNLELRVAERTEALEQQSLRLRTAAEVARDAASAPNLDVLLDQAARLIRDRFGFYHTGIFLLDDKREYAVLRASPSDAGKIMLERRHSLKVGEQGIVGRVAGTGEPRIALDTGVDPVYFNNPLLPNTHSEMALPLKTPEGTIGVVDIQSDQPEAFTQDDIAIVQVMADQLATAIQRTNLLQQVQMQLDQLERSYHSFTEQTWQTFGRATRQNLGYKFDNIRLDSVRATPENTRLVTEKVSQLTGAGRIEGQSMEVPIRLRGQVIGVVNLRFQSGRVPEATADMIQQVSDRLATALENARLLEDSLRRANKERAIGEITTKISASVNMRNVLQTAVEELGRAIPGSDVVIQFRPDTEL